MCRPPRVDATGLLDEGVRRQEVDVARAPRPPGQRLPADGEVVIRVAGVLEHEAAVVERQLVVAAIDDRVEHRPDRVARREDREPGAEGREVDRLARLEALDVRVAGAVEGDPPTRGEAAQKGPTGDARPLAQKRVDVEDGAPAVWPCELEERVDRSLGERPPPRRGPLDPVVGELQRTAFFTSALIFASSFGVSSVTANEVGHMTPSSMFAASSKPSVAYLDLNLAALLKKQTTLPSSLA